MPVMPESSHDPEVLLQRYLEGSLSESEAASLLELLQSRSDLAERLFSELSLDAMLRELKGGASDAAMPAPPLFRRPQARFTWATLGGVAALAACTTLLASWVLRSAGPTNDDEATTAAIAVLARGVNLQWEGDAYAPGAPLTPGLLRLKAGVAQIEFYQGARVTLEGPAEFRLISSSEAFCSAGKLSAHVPPQAKGFKIQTPQGTIVDLGTDFGLDLTAAAPAVHVFKGEVELHSTAASMLSLKEGQAMALADPARTLAADQSAFASLGDLDERTAESHRLAFEHWLTASAVWNNDPALLLRFDFQDRVDTRSLRNHATRAVHVPAGSIVGCDWTEGRWPGKRALDFRNVSDRVRLSLPGDCTALTLSAWVRVDGLDRAFNSLFMGEGYADGTIHWQITREGKLRLGIAGRGGKRSADHDTPPLFTPERFGQWLHLATVYDPEFKEVRHYLNGELVARVPVTHVFALRLQVAELGNWNVGGQDRIAVRHFSGAMDEFMLFKRMLSEEEIRRL